MPYETDGIYLGNKYYEATKAECGEGNGDNGGGTSNVYTYQDRIDETKDCSYLFYNYKGTNSNIVKNLNTTGVTDMKYMFSGCTSLTSLDLSNFNTNEVTNMSSMFSGCNSLTSIDLSNFNTSKVTNMNTMFNECYNLETLDLSNFDTSKVTSMSNTFYRCTDLTSLNLSNFNTSKVTNMNGMFHNGLDIPVLDLSSFDTSKVTNISNMFNGYTKLETVLGVLDLISATNVSLMFNNCRALTTVTVKNIKKSLNLGSAASYGTLLTLDSLTNTIKELWDYSSDTTTYTLTLSTPSKELLANVYVKLITPTEEQIAQDANIINKKPCEVCQSTDEGAMLITDYATLKNWNIV